VSEPITFLASLPPIMSAIRMGLDETRLQLSIPATEREVVGKLGELHGKVLSVAILVVERETLTDVDDGTTEEEAERGRVRLDRRRARK
jgi:hypothetical protein